VARLSRIEIDKVEEKTTLTRMSLPIQPMLGCLGTAVTDPQGKAVTVYTSGPNGGNLDYNGIVAGVTMHFPVFVPGGLFYLSDGHAIQGSGEVLMTGIECGMKKVRFTVWVEKDRKIRWPRGENEDFIFTIGAAEPPLEQSLQHATTEMLRWLQEDYVLDKRSAGILLGMCVEYEVGNVVDPAWAMVCKMPKSILRQLEDEQGQTPLHLAARAENSALVERLLLGGIDVNAKDKFGWSAIHLATAQGLEDVVKLLIDRGGDINAKDKTGETSLHIASELGRKALVELFLAKGVDIDARRDDGVTPLHLAAWHGRMSIEELLIAKGADVNAKLDNGRTLLHFAAQKGRRDLAESLIAKGVNVNVKDMAGVTPLHLAAIEGQKSLIELLIANGANVNARIWNGRTPLYFAAEGYQMVIAELLITKGANVNMKDNNGQTILHIATGLGWKEFVELLITKGAEVNAKTDEGDTPLSLAKGDNILFKNFFGSGYAGLGRK